MFFATIKLEAINRNGLVILLLLLLLSWAGGFTTLHVHPSLRRRSRRLLLCSCVVTGGGDYARTRADKWGHAKWSRFATSREILNYIVKNTTLMCCTCSSSIIVNCDEEDADVRSCVGHEGVYYYIFIDRVVYM